MNHCQKPNTRKWIFAVHGYVASAVFSVYVHVCTYMQAGVGKGREEVWQEKHPQ